MNGTAIGFRSERGPVLIAIMVSIGLAALDTTILSTAVASIVDELGGFRDFPWLFSIYLLAQTVTVPLYARLADMFGRKPLILFGISVFLIGSILCGLATDMLALIVFRGIQGLGAGAIQPIARTISGDVFAVQERPRVQGYIGLVWAFASIAGPTIGGLFSQFLTWRAIFFVNIPLCVLAAVLLWRNFQENVERRPHRIDYTGAVVLTAMLSLVLLGLLEGGVAWAWDSPTSFALFGSAATLAVVFVLVERRATEPVLPVRVVLRRVVLTTSLTAAVIGMLLVGLSSYLPTYLQGAYAVDPVWAGLVVAPVMIGWSISTRLSGHLYLRFGFRTSVLLGAAITAAAFTLLAMTLHLGLPVLVATICFVVGLGLGLMASPSLIMAQASVPWNERAVVTGTNSFMRTLGSTIGVAILGSVANAVIANGAGPDDPATLADAAVVMFTVTAGLSFLAILTAAVMPATRTSAILEAGGEVVDPPG